MSDKTPRVRALTAEEIKYLSSRCTERLREEEGYMTFHADAFESLDGAPLSFGMYYVRSGFVTEYQADNKRRYIVHIYG
jgi:hypothetical protein